MKWRVGDVLYASVNGGFRSNFHAKIIKITPIRYNRQEKMRITLQYRANGIIREFEGFYEDLVKDFLFSKQAIARRFL